MITGFNTDVKHADIVYHVQTEDKGLQNPLIESLIYVKGAILDAFRTHYREFLDSDSFSETLLQKILEFQHRQIVSSIRRGTYQKGMLLESYVDGNFTFEFNSLSEPSSPLRDTASSSQGPGQGTSVPPRDASQASPRNVRAPEGLAAYSPPSGVAPANLATAKVAEAEAMRLPSVDVSALSGQQGIEICVDGSKDFHGGEQVDLQIHVQSRQSRIRIENVQVVIKIIGTSFSPRLYAGKTDRTGSLRLSFALPAFAGGSAALIIQASTPIGNDEVKYLIKKNK